MGLAGTTLFPLASQMPMTSTGFQFGSQLAPSPAVWAQTATNQLAALQQQQLQQHQLQQQQQPQWQQHQQQQQQQQQQHQALFFLNPAAMATPVNAANLQTEPSNKMQNVTVDENGHSQFAENFVANHLENGNTSEAPNGDTKLSAAGIDDKDNAIFYDASS
jgi:dipeptidase